jgi:uncharacterized protein
MTDRPKQPLTAADVLRRYKDEEEQPEFLDRPLDDVNQVGLFGSYPIHLAATRGIIEEVNAFLDGGADVNAAGEHGFTPLHNAVGQEHIEVVKLLLERGADVTRKNDWGSTALDRAKMKKRDDIADLLKQYGA